MKKLSIHCIPLLSLAMMGYAVSASASTIITDPNAKIGEQAFRLNKPHVSRTMNDEKLERILKSRYRNDRSGVCVAAAYIEKEKVSRAKVCANEQDDDLLEGAAAFEIGSISKTMTAAMLASLIDEGKISLEDRVSLYLPPDVSLPSYNGQPILIKHLVTHTSALPSYPDAFLPADENNPYAHISQQRLLEALETVTLTRAPGTEYAYSNMGFMLLSYVIAETAGMDLETLLQQRLFEPLKMKRAYIAQLPRHTGVVVGHSENSRQVNSPWDFQVNLAGVGGVRATLNDMVKYAQAQMGIGDPATVAILQQTHQLIDVSGNASNLPPQGMAWGHSVINNTDYLTHAGGTGGFSSLIVVDTQNQLALVMMFDAAVIDPGTAVAMHLFDANYPLPGPRVVAAPDADLLNAMQGQYLLLDTVLTFTVNGQSLLVSLDDGTVLEMGYDSYGDFYPLLIDGVMTPVLDELGRQTFIWTSRDGSFQAQRL